MNIYDYMRENPAHYKFPTTWDEVQLWVNKSDGWMNDKLVREAQDMAVELNALNLQLMEAIDNCEFDGNGVFAAKQLVHAIRARGSDDPAAL